MVLHQHGLRLLAKTNGNIDLGSLRHIGAGSRLLVHDLTFFIIVRVAEVLVGVQLNMNIGIVGVFFLHLLVVLAQQIRHRDHLPVASGTTATEQHHQKHHQRNHRHSGAGNHRNGGHTVIILLGRTATGRSLGPFLGISAALGHGPGLIGLFGHHSLSSGASGRRLFLFRRGSAVGHLDHRIGGRRIVVKQQNRVLAELVHIVKHGRCAGVALRHIMGHGLHDDLLQTTGDVGIQRRGHGRAAIDVLDRHRHGRFSVIGRPAGHHLVHHNAQRVQIAAVIHPAALGLLGGNVMHAAQRFSGQSVALGHNAGNAEVRHLHRAVFQHHHIVGLDITVDNATAMGMLQSLADLHGKVQGLLPVQNALLLHVLLQADAVDQLHDDVIRIVGGGNIVHIDDIGMADHSDSLTLRMEAAAEFLVLGIFVLQNLDGHQTVQTVAPGFIYNSHAANADDFQNLVPVVQQAANILIVIHYENSFRL